MRNLVSNREITKGKPLPCIGPDAFGPTPNVTGFGHAQTFEETYARIKPLLKRVPITRVYNAAPLDILDFPVFSAVTPLAKDLTVHAGKGQNELAARISAIMEAIERICAEQVPPDRILVKSYNDVRLSENSVSVLDPELFDLPFQTTYHPNRHTSWIMAYDLLQDCHVYVPLDLVISPAREGICIGVETNGLASGNTYTEAVVHALYETVERDAISHDLFYAQHHDPMTSPVRPLQMINPKSVPLGSRSLIDRILQAGLSVSIQDLTHDIKIPAFGVTLADSSFPGADGRTITFAGYGANLNSEVALIRAITEAAQSHTGVTLAARDSFEGLRPIPERSAMLLRRIAVLYPRETLYFSSGMTVPFVDLYEELQEILKRLRSIGCRHCLVTDLTREDLGLPVVRVLVPGLAPPYGDSVRRPSERLLRTLI